jgi:metal-responsive CopG/Arc/MetJ family transcriptional regulator
MKEKISVTVEKPLVAFLDSLPGESRSEKIEKIIRQFRHAVEDRDLRRALAGQKDPEEEQRADQALRELMQEAMWRDE